MSDSGIWGISQEYFNKVYPKQRRVASNPTRQEPTTAETSTQQGESKFVKDSDGFWNQVWNEKEEYENDLRQESIRDFETWEIEQGE